MTKHIGIPAYEYDGMFGLDTTYMAYLATFGAVHLLTPDDGVLGIDLLVLPGGADVSPGRYSEKPGYILGKANPYFEHFDKVMLPEYIKRGVPIFGICRGLQTLNVHFGGSLHQHILNHPTSAADDRPEVAHGVYEMNHKNKSKPVFEVNSLHHQAINKLGIDIIPVLESEDNIIEAIRHSSLPISAVQWHPEELRDDYSAREITRLLSLEKS